MAANKNRETGDEAVADKGGERAVSDEQRTRRPGREISGPGAADFLAASGGLDMPENDPSKGTGALREEGLIDRERLVPHLDEPAPSSEREVLTPDSSKPGRKTQN
jgi:hypothetical protein